MSRRFTLSLEGPLLPDPSILLCLTYFQQLNCPTRIVHPERSEGSLSRSSNFQQLTNFLRFDKLSEPLCFQSLPTVKFCNSFVLITIRIAGGGYGGSLLTLTSSLTLTLVPRIGRRPVRGIPPLCAGYGSPTKGHGPGAGIPPHCLKLSTVNCRLLTASSHGSQGGFGGGACGDLLMDWNAVIIHSMPRGRSSGCWFRCTKKLWMSMGAPPHWRNAEGSGGPPGRPGAGIWVCK